MRSTLMSGKKIDIMQLYGTQGIGEVAKYAYVGQAVATPTDVGGVDEIFGNVRYDHSEYSSKRKSRTISRSLTTRTAHLLSQKKA